MRPSESEIDRIAALQGKSSSEVGRLLLSYGAEVQRRLEAQRLMQHHGQEFGPGATYVFTTKA